MALGAALFAAACYSSNYPRETRASVSLLEGLSDKLADYCRSGFRVDDRALTSEEMGEFYYGLAKARAFQQMAARREAPPASREEFAELADSYEKFVHDADRYRLSAAQTPGELAALLTEHEVVRRRAQSVLAALDKE